MQKLTKKLNILSFVAILFMVFTVSFLVSEKKANACDPDVCVRNVEISCYPNPNRVGIDESVTWIADASYGTGYYTYSWSGTNGLSGSGRSVSKSYSSSGTKTASVTVTSGGKEFYANCGSVVVAEEQDEILTGSCDVDDSNIQIGDYVDWSANASGGTGSYSYSWSGTSPLSGRTGSNVSVKYSTTGTKTGTVTIHSGNKSITRTCGTVYVEDDYNDNFTLSCNVNNTNISLGQTAIWNAYASGGNGNYYYSWSGTDGIYGTNSSISKYFNTLGTKRATVTVTSNNQTRSVVCPILVVGSNGYQNPNPAPLASLSSVYLNQVPYTGVEDNPQFWAFIIGLFMFSALGAYMIVSKKAKVERQNKILDFKNQNMIKRGIK